ncbi:MAG: hypothetical protein CM15mV27_1170 [Caudoviricetes sp.]|nr:MAG: hypothetical protein CM15mV27_1170 [Caudoviricetes sp.]
MKMISLQKEVKRYNQEFINKKRAFGELGHPDGPTVNLERVSHMITKLEPEGKNFIGEAKIMDTPYGKIVKGLIDEGAQLGVSSRGMGSLVQKNGANYVGKDFYLATAADIVADPSALQTLSLKVLWKIKSGYGTMVSLRHKILKSIKNIYKKQKDLN